MTNELAIGPTANELEVSLFGPGYGEAIAVQFGREIGVEFFDNAEPLQRSTRREIASPSQQECNNQYGNGEAPGRMLKDRCPYSLQKSF